MFRYPVVDRVLLCGMVYVITYFFTLMPLGTFFLITLFFFPFFFFCYSGKFACSYACAIPESTHPFFSTLCASCPVLPGLRLGGFQGS